MPHFCADGLHVFRRLVWQKRKKLYIRCELLTETEKKQDTVQKLGDQKPDQIAFYSMERNHKPHKKKTDQQSGHIDQKNGKSAAESV